MVVVGETGSSKGGTRGGEGGGDANRIGDTERREVRIDVMGRRGTGEWRNTVLRLLGENVMPNGF